MEARQVAAQQAAAAAAMMPPPPPPPPPTHPGCLTGLSSPNHPGTPTAEHEIGNQPLTHYASIPSPSSTLQSPQPVSPQQSLSPQTPVNRLEHLQQSFQHQNSKLACFDLFFYPDINITMEVRSLL